MPRVHELPLGLDASSDQPLFLQIARALTDDIRRGRLLPGAPLPGSRTLALTLGVHRNTVLAAFRELEAEGWVVTQPTTGTFVSTALPETAPRAFGPSMRSEMPALGFELGRAVEPDDLPPPLPKGVLSLAGGQPDVRYLPAAALARAYRRALRTHGQSLLNYGDARGHVTLRVALASMLSTTRGLAAGADNVLVSRGSQMALHLVAEALVRPGDVIAVEALGYRPAWQAFRQAGATLHALPVDAHGVQVDALARLCQERPVRAVYVTPHHQYPTTVGLSAARRLQLLALARAERIAIIEDDYDNEFHYEGRPTLPLASADTAGVVVYVGTLSKVLAPGLRLGFVVAPTALVDRLADLRRSIDRQGDQAVECAVAELIDDGELGRHTRRMKRIYGARRDLLAELLEQKLGQVVSFAIPAGGMALWVRVDPRPNPKLNVEQWATRALAHGVAFVPARRFGFDGRARPFARLGFASSTESELREAVRRMAAAC